MLQVLHATPSIHSTFRNVRKLLHPQGRLFLQELNPSEYKKCITIDRRLRVFSAETIQLHHGDEQNS